MSMVVFWLPWARLFMKINPLKMKLFSRYIFLPFVAALFSSCGKELLVVVQNSSELQRSKETVEIKWAEINKVRPAFHSDKITIYDKNGRVLPYQIIGRDSTLDERLIFQVDVDPRSESAYRIAPRKSPEFAPLVFGRVVPERMDDFAWENNRIAFRMYGPALEATGEVSNGIDVWVKKTDKLVVNSWYKKNDYHIDHGEGLDCYKVGRTLGAGAMAPVLHDTLILGGNYVTAKLLESGPIRISFMLTYKPFLVGSQFVTEYRILSLDAYSDFNRIQEVYSNEMVDSQVAAGIAKRKGGFVEGDEAAGTLSYWEPENVANGSTGLALVFPSGKVAIKELADHHGCITTYTGPLTYYAGAAWSRFVYKEKEAWFGEVKRFAKKLKTPLRVELK